jgi:hypothetical protein
LHWHLSLRRRNLPGGQATYSAAGREEEEEEEVSGEEEAAVVVVGVCGNTIRSSSKCCIVRWASGALMRRNRVTEEQASLSNIAKKCEY